jgi:predicted phosphate transport protein (TIGR00153 family)
MGFNLMPKNDSYFDDFDEAVALVAEIARVVERGMSVNPIDSAGLKRVFELEHAADKITARCLARLDNSFVTPIEREDIQRLMTGIDDVADHYEGFVTALDVYDVVEMRPELVEMAASTRELCEALMRAVSSVRKLNPTEVRAATTEAKRLEDVVDGLHREALRTLFRSRPEAHLLVSWKDLYDRLEETSDRGREVALIVEHILVRHS